MTVYAYRCQGCGPFDVERPMGTAPRAVTCPHCASDAARMYTVPLLARTSAPMAKALAAEEKSRDYPDVTTQLPPRRVRPGPPRDPRWRQLPKW